MGRTYVYGIVQGESEAPLGVVGVDDSTAVFMLSHRGLSCAVSAYQGAEFAALSQERLVRGLLAHQRVVERLMQEHSVLPVKFGTLLQSSGEVKALLAQGSGQFTKAFASVWDKVEIEVAATWDINRVLQEVATEEEVVRAREEIARRSQPTIEERLHLGRVVKACLDRRRDGYRKRMMDPLAPLSVAMAPNVLLSEGMVMNVAFLVDRARQQEFDERVRQIDLLLQGEVSFRVIGPLPPYSFSTVEVTRLAPGEIEEARRMLHLGEAALSEAVIRRAYRQRAADVHEMPEPGNGVEQFARIRRASETLLQYCQTQEGDRTGNGRSASVVQPMEGLLAITIRGPQGVEIEAARFGATERV